MPRTAPTPPRGGRPRPPLSAAGRAGRVLVPLLALLALSGPAFAAEPMVMKPQYRATVDRGVMVPMRDGKRLYADVIRPDAPGRFPVIIEYHPYRRGQHEPHVYFAERGFIGVRLDVRGTGGSDGINTDEYHPQEQLDGVDAVEWFAAQPYSSGSVGMFGWSYGGFTALQVAMQQPPHLKAIIPIYATDYRYSDDCHYTRGGNMRLYYDVGCYGGSMVALNALPPYPELPNWQELWKERLEKNEPYLLKWMHQQVDGPYWRPASVRPHYDKVKCPTYLMAGWHDGYVNAMLRMYTKLDAPKKLLVGPWVHKRPDTSVPGPRIDYLNECCRFFAQHLRGEDTGIMSEPAVTSFMQDRVPPVRTLDSLPGSWRSDADFPVAGTRELRFDLAGDGRLAMDAGARDRPQSELTYAYDPAVGVASRYWSAGMMPHYLAADQREDEARSLVFTSGPMEKDVRILGWPRVVVHAAATASVVSFVAKLSDVAPDGTSALISDGSLNGTRRDSLADPEAMEPGRFYQLEIPMTPTGWKLAAGHRLRLAISSGDFPNLWPTPEQAEVTLRHGGDRPSHVILPAVPESVLPAVTFLPSPAPEQAKLTFEELSPLTVIHDQFSDRVMVRKERENVFRTWVDRRHPADTTIIATHSYQVDQEGDAIKAVAEVAVRSDSTHFHIDIHLTVTKNGQPYFEKKWSGKELRRML